VSCCETSLRERLCHRKRGKLAGGYALTVIAALTVWVPVAAAHAPEPEPAPRIGFCTNLACAGGKIRSGSTVPERTAAAAGVYYSFLAGAITNSERKELLALFDAEYDELEEHPKFAGLPNMLLMQSDSRNVRYLRWTPAREGPLPCIVFLHGFGGLLSIYMKILVESRLGRDFVIIAPVLDNNGQWWSDAGQDVVDRLTASYLPAVVDKERVYLVGLSNGATGATLTAAAPELSQRFRGFALVSGLAHLPPEASTDADVLVIHGSQDTLIEPAHIKEGATRLSDAGAKVTVRTLDSNHFLILNRKKGLTAALAKWVAADP